MKVIIPLAGKGTRLGRTRISTPKPMLKIAGKPVMAYILDDLRELAASRRSSTSPGTSRRKSRSTRRREFADFRRSSSSRRCRTARPAR